MCKPKTDEKLYYKRLFLRALEKFINLTIN